MSVKWRGETSIIDMLASGVTNISGTLVEEQDIRIFHYLREKPLLKEFTKMGEAGLCKCSTERPISSELWANSAFNAVRAKPCHASPSLS